MAVEFRCNWAWLSLLWFVSVTVSAIQEVDGISIVLAAEKNSANHKQARRKLDDVGGSIDIDCGLLNEHGYTDSKTEIPYTTDSKFIETGKNRDILIEFNFKRLEGIFRNVRSFAEGKRNCYTLRHPEGRNTVYLLRASFMYGNYDSLNKLPKFDLYIGVNLWDTVNFDNASHIVIKEILHVPPMDFVHVCLLNTDEGTPFISALEMRHLHSSIYNKSRTLALYKRLDFGSTTHEIVRFKEDSYDRIWYPYILPNCEPLSTNLTIDSFNNAYRLPSTVMRTAVTPTNSNEPLEVRFDAGDPSLKFYVFMHFAEIKELQENEHREFNITVNGKLLDESVDYVVLNYLDPTTIHNPQPITGPNLWFTLNRKNNSTLPPILNAMEIYYDKDSYHQPTDQEEVNAIMDIKKAYTIKSWQGDPCAPIYSWDGLNCSYNGYNAPRIIEVNLSSSNLSGTISQSFSMLKSLEYLDLSDNRLTGSLPDFFIHLPRLKTLNLSGNRLSGEIPSPLRERSSNGSLLLSVEGNPDLCQNPPCKEDNSTFPLHAVIAIISSVVFLIVLGILVCIIWRKKFSKKPANQPVTSREEVVLKSSNTQFTYSQIIDITNNFEKMIGKGGSGTVYHGSLFDDTQVAVKLLSSSESSKQFQTEAFYLSPPVASLSTISKSFNVPSLTVQRKASSSVHASFQSQQVSRRSGDFEPDVWHRDYVLSLHNKYTEQAYEEESMMLRADVRNLLSETVNPLNQLELIDILQRLGLGYHFKSEINKILENIYNVDKVKSKLNLHATALEFRLLRQHGYEISTDVFDRFKDGNFQTSLSQDIKGMLSLYEASFHLMEDETIMENAATDFIISKSLKEFVSKNQGHELISQVKHALEVPLHWRLPRWEARWFISEYERMHNTHPTLLQLAKLDYNMVQAIYQEEVKSNIRWWERTGLEKKINFARCRVTGNYIWGLGTKDEPNAGNLRRVMGKLCVIITLTDDLYDVHGTLEELELFTEAILRWDANDLDSLPEHMKVAFFAIYNFVDELTSDLQSKKGLNVYSYLKKAWQDMCKAYMVEAKWYHGGKTPRLKEYLENARVSIGAPNLLLHAYLSMPNNPIRKLELDALDHHSDLPYFTGLVARLINDLGSFKREKETGDVSSSIQCHMNETGASEEEAIKHVKSMMYKTWQMMNQHVATSSSFSRDFNVTAWGMNRAAVFYYHCGDDSFTHQDSEFKNRLRSLLFEHIPI